MHKFIIHSQNFKNDGAFSCRTIEASDIHEALRKRQESSAKCWTPIAWTLWDDTTHKQTLSEQREQAIAAGRVIEKVGDTYVARGAGNELTAPQAKRTAPTHTPAKAAVSLPPESEPAKLALPYFAEQQARAKFDPFKGFFKNSETGEEHAVHKQLDIFDNTQRTCGSFGRSPDLEATNPLHGSATLLLGD